MPATFSAYPADVEGVEGHVLSVNGHPGFFDNATCQLISEYLAWSRPSDTSPVEIQAEPAPQPRGPRYRA